MIPGLYDLPADQYHALTDMLSAGVANTMLARSPAHARHEALFSVEDESKPKDRGTAAHALLFEGEDRMAVIDFPDWRKKEAQEQRDAAREAGKVPMLTKDYAPVLEMVAAARAAWDACPDLEGYRFEDGVPERSLIWDENGVACRCKPDWYANDRRVMLDAKFTATSAEPEQIARHLISQALDQRAAFYTRGGQAFARVAPKYVYLFQEVDPPYCTSFVGVSPAMLELGMSKADWAIGKWRECQATGKWPGYDNRIHYAEPPAWALEQWGMREEAEPSGYAYSPEQLWGKPK